MPPLGSGGIRAGCPLAGAPLVNWLLRIQAYGLALYSAFFRPGVARMRRKECGVHKLQWGKSIPAEAKTQLNPLKPRPS